MPSVDLWLSVEFMELLVQVEFGHLAMKDPRRTVCMCVSMRVCVSVCVCACVRVYTSINLRVSQYQQTLSRKSLKLNCVVVNCAK